MRLFNILPIEQGENMKDEDFLLKEKYKAKKSLRFFLDLLRLKLGYPLAYLLGWQPFLNLNIDLKYRVLIPRPETEFWLERYVFPGLKEMENSEVLDIFAGSGAMGLAVAKNFPHVLVTLSDKYSRAIKQIKINAKINYVENIKLVQSDVFDEISGKYDLILANPPYVSGNFKYTKFSWTVLFFEPLEAVFSKKRGLFFIEELLKNAKGYMKPGASLFIEFDPWQKSEIESMAKNLGWTDINFLKDQYSRTRIVRLTNI